jgi:N-acetylglucosaminyl-diphospho-decaprenol L-rhamnosyltransferase
MSRVATAYPLLRPLPKFAPPNHAAPFVSVVIVNHNRWHETSRLVGQIESSRAFQSGEAEVMIVDNHSSAHPIASRLRRRPGVSLRRWGRNYGFATAANEGCRLSRGEWFLLLNPDVTTPGGFIESVISKAHALVGCEPRVGIVGFSLRNEDGTLQHSSGPLPSLFGTIAGLARPRSRRKYHRLAPSQWSPVPWVSGCCLLVRRDCFRDLRGFDENFFLYYEDVDLCLRASKNHWAVCYDPSLHVIHHDPLHSRKVPAYLRLYTRHALLTYGAKHWPRWQHFVLSGLIRWDAWIRSARARRNGESEGAAVFDEIQGIAGDLVQGRPDAARKRLDGVVRQSEKLSVG